MLKWNFVSRKFLRPWNEGYDELCAPAVGVIGDTRDCIRINVHKQVYHLDEYQSKSQRMETIGRFI